MRKEKNGKNVYVLNAQNDLFVQNKKNEIVTVHLYQKNIIRIMKLFRKVMEEVRKPGDYCSSCLKGSSYMNITMRRWNLSENLGELP